MKKQMLLIAAGIALLCVSCAKEKSCRCSVKGRQDTRIINITKGSCEDINYAQYKDDLDTLHTDLIICTDYPFKADSTIIYTK